MKDCFRKISHACSLSASVLLTTLATVIFSFTAVSCSKTDSEPALDISLNIPKAPRTVTIGQEIAIYSYYGKNPLVTDYVLLKGNTRIEFPIDKVESDHFTFKIGSNFKSGKYTFCIRRDKQEVECGTVDWTLAGEIEPTLTGSVVGKVSCDGNPIEGVAVSDGYEIVYTDSKGIYNLQSQKKNGMVFITVPSGYEVASKQSYTSDADGILPLFWRKTTKNSSTQERIDFTLYPADQTSHTAMFFGDMHLAGGKQNDLTQFSSFTSDIASYCSTHKSEKIYAFTLGDMTWDLYWYEKNYCFTQYLQSMQPVKGMQVFHTIGNHDHNMKTSVSGATAGWNAVDWDTAGQFRTDLGPNYYSVNIGKIHYVVVDDIYCTNTTGGGSDDRKYDQKVSDDCIAWLKKDLAKVSKMTPIIVSMHASVHSSDGSNALDNSTALKNCFSGFPKVIFVSGHSHKMFTLNCTGSYSHISEYNSGAVCAAWWWAGYYYKHLNIAQDGAPAGYRIMNVNGTDTPSYFKGTSKDATVQFRAYDRNKIDFSTYNLPDSGPTQIKTWSGASTSNYVYINVWDWATTWSVKVKENGKDLTVTRVNDYDPLFCLAYVIKRYNGKTGTISFPANKTHHMFRVQASSASSTLEITVTDDEGREYKETMTRPRNFGTDSY